MKKKDRIKNKEDSFEIVETFGINLGESDFDKEKGTAIITALKRGWSYNGNFYSDEVAESLCNLLLERKKIFANHLPKEEKALGRKITGENGWAATIEDAFSDKGSAKAKIRFTKNTATSWLVEEAKAHPEEIQFSIDALCLAHRGEAEGKEGVIIEKFVGLHSLDVVDYASAGGRLHSIQASKQEKTALVSTLEAFGQKLKDKVDKSVERSKLNILLYSFQSMLDWLKYDVKPEDYDKEADELIATFLEEFNKINIKSAYESKRERGDKDMTLKEFKKENPEAVQALVDELKESIKKELKLQEKLDTIKDLEDASKVSKESVERLEGELKESKKSLEDANKLLEEFKLKDKKMERKLFVEAKLEDSKMGKLSDLSEYLQKSLMDLNKDEAEIEEAVKSYKSLIGGSTKVVGVGETFPENKKENKKIDKAVASDDDKAASLLR